MEEVRGWLQSIGLDRYAAKFEDEGWDTLDILYHMKPDEIERCIDKPGHRRRFEIGLQENPPPTKASGSGRARTIDIDKKPKESLPDSKKSQELPKVAVAEVSTLSHVVTSTDTEDCLRATADRKQSKSLGDFSVQTQIAVKPILNETQSDRTEKLLNTQSVDVFQVPETDFFISNEVQFFEHIGTGKENARIVSKSDIRQIEREYESTQQTSYLDDKRIGRDADRYLQASCQVTAELSDITTLTKCVGVEADIGTFRADDALLAIVDTEKKYIELDNQDIRKIERNYESTHKTSDLDDEKEGREEDNKLQVSCQETFELSDIIPISKCVVAEADIDTLRADDELLAIVDTEKKYTQLDNPDIRQIERTYEITHQTSDLDDKQEGREADNKLQVSCQENSELSDITTLSSVEGAEADIDTFRADGESLAIVDTEKKYTEIENSDVRQIERKYESTHQTSDLDYKREGREADNKLQVSCQETSELSDITTLSSVEDAEADNDTFRADDESLAIVDTEKKYTEIENSDIRQIERTYESTHQTSDLDDEQEGREADNKLQVSCQENSELSDVTPLSKFAGANAAIDSSRADGKSFTMFDTEEENAGFDNSDKGQIENYENTHQTSDLDDKREGREKDNKLHCQERPELSDATTLSRFKGADAVIDTSRAGGESLAMVETENAEIDNSDIRQTETSDLDDKRKDRETDNKLQVSCQETAELSDVTTLSRYEGTEDANGTFRADGESLSMVDTFYVEGARNKIISTSFGETQVDRRVCTRAYTEGAITKGSQKHSSSELAGVVKVTDDQFSDSSCDDDTSSLEELVIDRRREGYQASLELSSPMPVTRATIVKDSKNVTIANKAEVYHVHSKEERESSNFEDQICSVVETYKQKDHLYVETKAFTELTEIIEDRHWALIAGKPGDGKTTMAAHLMLKYMKKGFKPVFVTSPQDWKILVEGGNKSKKEQGQFVIIDDIFGSMCVDQQKVSEWVSFIDFMNRVVDKRKGHLVVVCTSRKYIFNDVKTKIDKFSCFNNTSIVDMTSKELELTCSEKEHIWKKYTKEYSVESEDPSCISQNVPSPHGFPHCVELYCSNQFLRNQGVDFFENPMKYICREIKNFLENDKIKYCILLLILLNKNRLREDVLQQLCFSDPPKDVLKLFKVAGLSVDYAQSELKKALVSLKNTYINEHLDGVYSFSHESIKENVAFMLIQDNPLYAIEELKYSYLADHTRCHGYNAGSDESVFVLPSFCTTALIDRVLKEIFLGNSMSVCKHDIWNDQFLIEKMIKSLLNRLALDEDKPDLIKKIIFLSDQFQHVYSSLIPCLIYCQREQAVQMILDNKKIIGFIDCNDLQKTMTLAFVLACFYLPTSNIDTKLIELGANVKMKWTNAQLNLLQYHVNRELSTSIPSFDQSFYESFKANLLTLKCKRELELVMSAAKPPAKQVAKRSSYYR